MTQPRDPRRDLRLERLGDDSRPAFYGEAAHVAADEEQARRTAYEALIDAVFTAPGAAEWLFSLKAAVAAILARKESAPRPPVVSDAIQSSDPTARP